MFIFLSGMCLTSYSLIKKMKMWNMYLLSLVVPHLSNEDFLSFIMISKMTQHPYILQARLDPSRHYECDVRDKHSILASLLYGEEVFLFVQEGPRRMYLHHPFLPHKIILFREDVKIFQDIYCNLWVVTEESIEKKHKAARVSYNYHHSHLILYYVTPTHELWMLSYHESTLLLHEKIMTHISCFNVGIRYCTAVDHNSSVFLIEHEFQHIKKLLEFPTTVTSCTHLEHEDLVMFTIITEGETRYHYTYFNNYMKCISTAPIRMRGDGSVSKKLLRASAAYDSEIIHVACDSHGNFVIIKRQNKSRV